jgi:hypothetical protein
MFMYRISSEIAKMRELQGADDWCLMRTSDLSLYFVNRGHLHLS